VDAIRGVVNDTPTNFFYINNGGVPTSAAHPKPHRPHLAAGDTGDNLTVSGGLVT